MSLEDSDINQVRADYPENSFRKNSSDMLFIKHLESQEILPSELKLLARENVCAKLHVARK